MSVCPACTKLVSGLVQFIFGWGDPESMAWNEFRNWIAHRRPLPAWAEHIRPTNRSRRLWDAFHPENDPDQEYRYSKEAYRGWFSDFFRNQIERSSDLDKKFFDGFATSSANPLLCIKQFKVYAGLRTWPEVILSLAVIYNQTTARGARYDSQEMGSLSSPLWIRISQQEHGRSLVRAMTQQPRDQMGRSWWRTVFYILQSCSLLQEQNGSFNEWVERAGLLTLLRDAGEYNNDPASHLTWRKQWSRSSIKPWDSPSQAEDLPGISASTFEYILRDHHYPGSLNLFKADSTNLKFVKGTSLANHILDAEAREDPERKEYWQAIYHSGALSKSPIAEINMAIYFAVSKGEEMQFLVEDDSGKLATCESFPSELKALNSPNCTKRQRV